MPDLFLFDPASAAVVLGGTAVATFARAGWRDIGVTWREAAALTRPRFDFSAARAALASEIESIRHDGVLRAALAPVADHELADCTAALVRHRSVSALVEQHEQHRARRDARRGRALETLEQAAELAPVFGLVGTLIGLSQLPAAGLGSEGAVMAAVSTAILTTLYGLLTAHLLILPLAGMIERSGHEEECQRARLIQWLAEQIAPVCPPAAVPIKPGIAA